MSRQIEATTVDDDGATLEPCPFCGGEAQFITLGSTVGLPQYQVECADDCGAGHPANSALDAVADWNTRVNSFASLKQENEVLRAAIESEAARRAYAAGLGVSEWEALLWPEARAALKGDG